MRNVPPILEWPIYICVCVCVRFPVAQMVEHGTSNAKIMGSIPRESKRLIKCKKKNL